MHSILFSMATLVLERALKKNSSDIWIKEWSPVQAATEKRLTADVARCRCGLRFEFEYTEGRSSINPVSAWGSFGGTDKS